MTIMGSLTADIEIAQEYLQRGVPVWLVRSPSRVPYAATTVTSSPTPPLRPSIWFNDKIEPWAAVIHNGPPSVTRNRACQSIRSYNIKLGHAAYYKPENELVPELLPLKLPSSLSFFPPQPATNAIGPQASTSHTNAATLSPGNPLECDSQANLNQRETAAHAGAIISQAYARPADSQPKPNQRVKAKVANNINRAKFAVPKSSWEPPAASPWKSALSSVDSAESNILVHPDRDLLRGYLFPDPYLLTKEDDGSAGRRSLYIIAWLGIRAKWMEWVIDNQDDVKRYPRPQEWRDALADVAGKMGLMTLWARGGDTRQGTGTSSKNSTTNSSSTAQQQPKRRKVASDSKPPVDLSLVNGPINICWNGEQIVSADALQREIFVVPNNVAQEVVWDLYDHNFRLELLALDRCVIPRADALQREIFVVPNNVAQEVVWDLYDHNFRLELLALDRCVIPRGKLSELEGLERDDKVRRCFPHEAMVTLDLPIEDRGLGAAEWGHRMQWVDAFRSLLMDWPGCPQVLKSKAAITYFSTGHIVSDEKTIAEVESCAYPFYCQTFFNYFGRAPSIPHSLPAFDYYA
ncbi:hypothetical protein CVT26_007774 [Gymnopilus dilepis]|uniref:Uncharacterized protein n=1 Tax=Gymnopilus dilepis TaxID=231916 RepID=A0A409YJZ8_9AGAR|nr:hypothetical protein CVT26_007774 [Gymnopilus dilepis]